VRTDHVVLPHILRSRGYLLNVASLAAAAHAPLMTSYAASKAGVEALTNSLRSELAPTGARAGCAYFGFIDTDMVRDGFAHPSSAVMRPLMPGFLGRPIAVSYAADAIVRAVERRSARTWAPRWVGAALAIRGIVQPLAERRVNSSNELVRALELAAEPAPVGRAR
jgi:NAD(P)-dependent dehydrogenase (short-subunit alcohol dehydrogenase family)